MTAYNEKNGAVLKVVLLAALLSGLVYYLQSKIGINIPDEGYLIYGAVQTAAGKVPLMDFAGYDPGRYYWLAVWSLLFGEGLLAMRFYLALFGGIGVCLGLLAARRVIKSFWGLIPVGLLLLLWIFPRYHPFEVTFALATLLFATRLIESPTERRYFSAGVLVGLAAFFGRNLGLYGFLAISATVLYIWLRLERESLLRRYAIFIGGVCLGYSPIFIMAIFIPGFFSGFIDSVLFLFKVKATNVPLPVPWPWLAFYVKSGWFIFAEIFFLGILFLVMPLFYILGLIRLPFIKKDNVKANALFTASLFTGIFFMHYAFSRADINHLSRGIHPLFLAMLALVFVHQGRHRKVLISILALFLTVTTLFGIIPEKPFVKKNILERGRFLEYPIRGEKIWLTRGQINAISTTERLVGEMVPEDERLFLAPYLAMMYYILERDSPTWNTYFIFKASPEEQKRVIASLERNNVRWAIVGDPPLDGRDDLRFSRTYDLVWAYLLQNYELVDPLRNISGYVLIHKRVDTVKKTY